MLIRKASTHSGGALVALMPVSLNGVTPDQSGGWMIAACHRSRLEYGRAAKPEDVRLSYVFISLMAAETAMNSGFTVLHYIENEAVRSAVDHMMAVGEIEVV